MRDERLGPLLLCACIAVISVMEKECTVGVLRRARGVWTVGEVACVNLSPPREQAKPKLKLRRAGLNAGEKYCLNCRL